MKYSSLKQFIQMHTQSLKPHPEGNPPQGATSQLISEVAPHSLADRAGMEAGDLLLSFNGEVASRMDPRLYLDRSNQREYLFYSRRQKSRFLLKTSGIAPGLSLEPTTPAIETSYSPEEGNPSFLEILWKRREWDLLEKFSRETLEEREEENHPALLFLGASLWEKGQKEEGLSQMERYLRDFVYNWTTNFAAIGNYYRSKELWEKGKKEESRQAIEKAWKADQKEAFSQFWTSHWDDQPPSQQSPWLGQKFPLYYKLNTLVQGKRTLELASTLDRLEKGQFFAICLLSSYRGNGPYNDFLLRYQNYIRHFRDYLFGLHVITEVAEKPADRDHYFEAENEILQAALPLEILHDSKGEISRAINPQGSPMILLLDWEGQILYTGELSEVDFWNTLHLSLEGKKREKELARLLLQQNLANMAQIKEAVSRSEGLGAPGFAEVIVRDEIVDEERAARLLAKIDERNIICSHCQAVNPAAHFASAEEFLCQECDEELVLIEERGEKKEESPSPGSKDLENTVVEEGEKRDGAMDPTLLEKENMEHSMIEKAATRVSSAEGEAGSQDESGPFLKGTKLKGDLEIVQVLGEGGMGAVYLGRQKSLQRDVAVKTLHSGLRRDQEIKERFEREAKTVAQLDHPNIVGVYDVGEHQGQPYIVMEYIEGESLQEKIDSQGKMAEKEALEIALQVAKGLAKAHEEGVLHRDLKPDNIFIDKGGKAKIGDFGIAKNLHQSSLTQTGTVMGTPHYMSPEQAEGREVDARSDIYSLGATLFHAVIGRPPFGGDSPMTIMYKQINMPVSIPREIRKDISPPVREMIKLAMEKDKWRRPESAKALVKRLEGALQDLERGVSSEKAGGVATVAPPSSTSSSPLQSGQPAGAPEASGEFSWPLSPKVVAAGGGVVFLFIFLFSLPLIFPNNQKGEHSPPEANKDQSQSSGKKSIIDSKEEDVKKADYRIHKKIDRLREKSELAEAMKIIEENLKKFPDDYHLARKKRIVSELLEKQKEKFKKASQLREKAKKYEKAGRYGLALTHYSQAYDLNPDPKFYKKKKELTRKTLDQAIKKSDYIKALKLKDALLKMNETYPNWEEKFFKNFQANVQRSYSRVLSTYERKLKEMKKEVEEVQNKYQKLRDKLRSTSYKDRPKLYPKLRKLRRKRKKVRKEYHDKRGTFTRSLYKVRKHYSSLLRKWQRHIYRPAYPGGEEMSYREKRALYRKLSDQQQFLSKMYRDYSDKLSH